MITSGILGIKLPLNSVQWSLCLGHLFTAGFPDQSEFPNVLSKPGASFVCCCTDNSGGYYVSHSETGSL